MSRDLRSDQVLEAIHLGSTQGEGRDPTYTHSYLLPQNGLNRLFSIKLPYWCESDESSLEERLLSLKVFADKYARVLKDGGYQRVSTGDIEGRKLVG